MNKKTIEKAIYAYVIIITLICAMLIGITFPISTNILNFVIELGVVDDYILPFAGFVFTAIIVSAIVVIISPLMKLYIQYTIHGELGDVRKYFTAKHLPLKYLLGEPDTTGELFCIWASQIVFLLILYLAFPLIVYIPQLIIAIFYIYALTKPRKILKGFADITRTSDE